MKHASTSLAALVALAATGPLTAQAPAGQADPVPFATAMPVDAASLARITGRADTAMEIRASNSSTVANNSVIGHSQTGTISFDDAAFQNLSGLSLLSANTGNNVSINSSLNVNVSLRP